MTKTGLLLKEEGTVQLDALEMIRDLSGNCQLYAKLCSIKFNSSSSSKKGRITVQVVRPGELDLLVQLRQAGQDTGDTMSDKDELIFLGKTSLTLAV